MKMSMIHRLHSLFHFVSSTHEFSGDSPVQPAVSSSPDNANSARHRATRSLPEENGTHFSFGARRYASSGPRRLFVPQEFSLPPIFEPGVVRHRPLLRAPPNGG